MNIQDLIVAIRQAATGGDATGRLVLFGAFIVVVAAVLLAVVWLVKLRSPESRLEALLEARAEESATSRWPFRIAALVLVLAAFVGFQSYSGRPSQCAQCHRGAGYEKAVAESPHKDVSCMSCHRQGGPILGGLTNAARYGRWILVYTTTKQTPEPEPGSVGPQACLSCHNDVRSGVSIANGIRVRHSDFLAQGTTCRECHNSVAHKVVEATRPTMDKCVVCHDGKKAPSTCSTCHAKDVTEARKDRRGMPKAQVKTGNCYGCHQEKPCLRCHGQTMPHPLDWTPSPAGPGSSGTHARAAFAERDTCWRCHDAPGKPLQPNPEFCASCHPRGFGQMHGGKAWVAEHGPEATGKKTGINSECCTCHGPGLCNNCHPASYDRLYAPKPPGPDNYKRDPAFPYDPDYYAY